jgi:hypothetical protein
MCLLPVQSDIARTARESDGLRLRAEAGHAIQAAHRWCISGTPLATPADLLAVLKFLRHQPFANDAWAQIALLPALCEGTPLGATSAAAVAAVVSRFGSGLSLLRAILQPILWRNTVARVRALGQLQLPPVCQVLLSVRLTPGEDIILRQIQRTHAPVVSLLRDLVKAGAEASAQADAVLSASRQALWDLRVACISAAAGDRALRSLGIVSLLSRNRNSSLAGACACILYFVI